MTWLRKLGRVFTWQWWLRYKPVELRIIRIEGTPSAQMVREGTRYYDRFYIERRGGWRRKWQRLFYSDSRHVFTGPQCESYGTFETAALAMEELRATFNEHDDLVVSKAPPAPKPESVTPPPSEPPDLRHLITEARRQAMGDGVVQILEDAMHALTSLNRVAWEMGYVWQFENRPQVASIISHCAASMEAMLVMVRDVETELAMRRREAVPMPSALPSGVHKTAYPGVVVSGPAFVTSAAPAPITPVNENATTAPPYTPLQELRDSAQRNEGILSLEDKDEPPPK